MSSMKTKRVYGVCDIAKIFAVYGDNNKIVEDAAADIQVFIDDVIPERNMGNNAAQFVNKNIMVAEKTVSFLMRSR